MHVCKTTLQNDHTQWFEIQFNSEMYLIVWGFYHNKKSTLLNVIHDNQ